MFDSRAVVVLGDRVNADMSVDAKPIMYFNLIKASVPFALVDIGKNTPELPPTDMCL